MTEGSVRFCPFCKEAFDDESRCPSHDLALVSLRELGRLAAVAGNDDAPESVWCVRHGRGPLAAGAFLTLVAFFLPFATLHGELTVTNTLLSLAHGRALRLWIVPMAALALLSLLARRRTPAQMRGARLAAIFVSLLPGAVVAFTLRGAFAAAARLSQQLHAGWHLEVGLGVWLVAFATGLLLWGSATLGQRSHARVR